MDLLDDEAFAADLMARCVDTGNDFARAQIAAGADTIGIGDAIASQVSPDQYERLILPHEQRPVRAVRDLGALVRLHICGNITHLLPGLGSLPIDILDVDHMVDMGAVRQAVGATVALAGNIDPAAGVRFGRPAGIREQIGEAYRRVGNPFMVCAGCEIPSGTPAENLKALCAPVAWRP